MKYTLLSLSLALLFTQSIYASNTQDKPNACPSIAAVKSVGITSALHDSTWGWLGYTNNQYDTNAKWTLAIFTGHQANDETEAVKQANIQLALVTTVEGPKSHDDKDEWGCVYFSNNEGFAIAVTPPLMQNLHSFAAKYRR